MKKIYVIGGLTSGFGGMETVFKKFYSLMNHNNEFEVTFFLIGTPKKKHNFDWLQGIQFKNLNAKLHFRALERFAAKYTLAKHINHDKPVAIISYDSLGSLVAKKTLRITSYSPPLISWTHFSFDTFSEKHQKRIAQADYHFAICDEIKKQMVICGIPEHRIHTIYNPTSRRHIVVPRPLKTIHFLYIGRIQYSDQKNLQELFHALAMTTCKNYQVDIVGSGNEDEILQLQQLAQSLNIEKQINWHGWQKDAWQYIQDTVKTVSALVLTSNYEGFPMVLGEAMAHGIYCIAADCPTGPADIINKNNGILYPLGNTQALSAALDYVCTHALPSPQEIQNSIEHLYDDQYIQKVKNIINHIS